MDDTTYNGWTNYETWATALWLDNDAGSYAFWNAEARDCWEAAPASQHVRELGFSRGKAATLELGNRLKSAIHDQSPELGACLYSDLLWAALSEVQWFEIAEHYINELPHETAQERKGENDHG
ncbi:hypothetical protein Pan44_08120 [Caulifigura coniformis]|uniref:Uncharacterized protein n=1 Tax=Caulifigura coniformis TaxID=2527983 RepID=A0A517S9J4_9PLAN|nr:hypothetical protein [Caulifigura coniformis]QDT52800.1 hypothetical protein Pan44_08120 [Caulifigura coniformis]